MPPGYHKEWHIGVRLVTTKKLVAFISGVPMTLKVRRKYVRCSISLAKQPERSSSVW